MRVLVTGSSGHLGEALMRSLPHRGYDVVGLDIKPSPSTHIVGSITDPKVVRESLQEIDAVLHTATLHKPHIATHARRDFVATNVEGTLSLLEAAAAAGVRSFIFTSTTSAFGAALTPSPADPAAWITEEVRPIPRNIYGVTKVAAEDLCELFHRTTATPCLILRTSRFFPEEDDNPEIRQSYSDDNVQVNEFLYRRVDLEDVVDAHVRALERAQAIGFGRYIISATSPFTRGDLMELRSNAPDVLRRLCPRFVDTYARHSWSMFASIDRVYVNERARTELGWRPKYDFAHVLDLLDAGQDYRSELARIVGSKGYHGTATQRRKDAE